MKVVPSTRVESSLGPVLLYSFHHIFTRCVFVLLWDFFVCLFDVILFFISSQMIGCLDVVSSPCELWRNEGVFVFWMFNVLLGSSGTGGGQQQQQQREQEFAHLKEIKEKKKEKKKGGRRSLSLLHEMKMINYRGFARLFEQRNIL